MRKVKNKNSLKKRRDGDLNPGDLLIIGLAVRRRTRLGHPDYILKKVIKNTCIKYNITILYLLII